MSDDGKKLKSAYELAMERLERADRKAGVARRSLDAGQKRRIAELRRNAEAKHAEIEIVYRDKLAAAAGDPQQIAELEEKRRIDSQRVDSALDSAIRGVKDGDGD